MKQQQGLNLRFVGEDADPIPNRSITLFQFPVRSPGGLVTLDRVTSFQVYLLALLSFQAHPASDPADICTHAVVWRLTLTGTPRDYRLSHRATVALFF